MLGVIPQGRDGGCGQISLYDEANLLVRLSECQAELVSGVLEQAATASHISCENRRLRQEAAGSSDRIQELHHRIGNHLQAVTGLLSARKVNEESPSARKALQKSVGCLASIAAIHNLLARDPVSDVLQLPELVQQLSQHLLISIGAENRIGVKVDVSPLALNAREATALVLILVELLWNSVEHGFPGEASGQITLRTVAGDDLAVLEVRDNGRGLPAGFDVDMERNLGLGLVTRLARRDLGGSISARNDGGAVFSVSFPARAFEGWE